MTGSNALGGRAFDVCHLSTTHRAIDNRIFDSEALSLARAGLAVVVVGLHPRDEDLRGVALRTLVSGSAPLPTRVVRAWRALRCGLRTKAAVFHIHEPELLAVGVALKILGKAVVYDVHEDVEAQLNSRTRRFGAAGRFVVSTWGAVELALGRLLDGVIVVDTHLASRFEKCKPSVVSNFPSSAFWAGARREREDGRFQMVYVGGVTEARGLGRLLDALDLVNGGAILQVIGDIPDSPLGRRLSGHPHVSLLGRVPWGEVASHLVNADLGVALLQPTRAYLKVEFLVKVYEYLSVGVPVLLSDFPKLRRQVDEFGFGMVVDPTDAAAIARAIEHLRDHPELRREMGERGRAVVEERFNWEQEEAKLLALYRRMLPASQIGTPEVAEASESER